jgi:lysozyme family protein
MALLGNEGGYVDNPADPGGATMWGVTERVARAWGYTGDMKDLPLNTAKAIAKKFYWDPYQCDQFDPRVAFQVLDAAYNGGHPAQWLQQAAGVTADGVIGSITVAAVRAADPMKIIARFNAYRLQYLGNLSTWATFGHGWANRIANNLIRGAS